MNCIVRLSIDQRVKNMAYNYYDMYDMKETLSEIDDALALIDDLETQIDRKKSLRKERWAAIQEKLRVDWTYDSNAIEGRFLTRGETLFFKKEGLTVEGKPFKDFLDARNHAETIDGFYEMIKDHRSITQGLIVVEN